MKLRGKEIFRSLTRRRYDLLRPWVEGETLLDIGAAEGWLGEVAAEEGKKVQLVDVADFNQTTLPHQLYNGRELPFGDNSFDTVMLLLTLHHCEDPGAVLGEAVRVAGKRLLVTETVYRTFWGRRVLTILDGGFNHSRSKGRMRPALHFKKAREWAMIFGEHGLKVCHQQETLRGLHRQHFFVLERSDDESS